MAKLSMNNLSQNIFYKDFYRPIILPILIVSIGLLGVYIGSKYYYSNVGDKLKEIVDDNIIDPTEVRNEINYIIKKNRIHYYINITSTIIETIFEGFMIIGIISYMITGIKILIFTHYLQINILVFLFGINTFLSLAVPTLQMSLIEYTYIKYLKSNVKGFFLDELSPMVILITYALIFARFNITGSKHLDSSTLYQIAILIIICFLFTRNIFFILASFRNLRKLNNYANIPENNIELLNEIKNHLISSFDQQP